MTVWSYCVEVPSTNSGSNGAPLEVKCSQLDFDTNSVIFQVAESASEIEDSNRVRIEKSSVSL